MASETTAHPATSNDEQVENIFKEEIGSPSKVTEKEGNSESEVVSGSLSESEDKDSTVVELPVPHIHDSSASNELGTSAAPELVTGTCNNNPNEMPRTKPTEELTGEHVDKRAVEEPIVVDAPEATTEAMEKLEEQSKCTPVSETPEPVLEVVNKSQGESVVVEQVEKEQKNKPDEMPTIESIEERKAAGESVDKQAVEHPIVVDAPEASIEATEKLEERSRSTLVSEIPEPEPVLQVVNSSQEKSAVVEQVEKEDKNKPDEAPTIEPIEEYKKEEPAVKTVEQQAVEQSSVVGFTEASTKAVEKLEEPPKIISFSEIPEPEPVRKVVNKPQNQSRVAEQVEKDSEKVELKESVEDGAVLKDANSEEKTSKDEEPEPQEQIPDVEGEQNDKESERVKQNESVEGETTKNKGTLSIQTKETPVSNEDQISEGEHPNPSEIVAHVSKDIQTSVITEELSGSIVDKVENVISSISTKDAAGSPAGMDDSSRDVMLVAENKQEEKPTLLWTNKVGDVGETLDRVAKSAANVEAKEPPGNELQEAKGEEAVKAAPGELEKEEEAKDGDGLQKPQDPTKEQAPTKPIQKNILTKVKQSLAKAKKAITGKSPSSKAPSSDSKGENDMKVK